MDDAVPIRQSEQLAAGMRAAGDDVEFIRVPDGKHGLTVDQWNAVLPRMFAFLAARGIQ